MPAADEAVREQVVRLAEVAEQAVEDVAARRVPLPGPHPRAGPVRRRFRLRLQRLRAADAVAAGVVPRGRFFPALDRKDAGIF